MPESAEAQVKEALLALLKERDIQHITMKEIAEKAKVSRGSLYLYYEDKFSIIEDLIEDMKEGLGKALFDADRTGNLRTLPGLVYVRDYPVLAE
ncbi:TetR family transcriptional regulator [Bacillus subtilis J26]|nr:TetR family transcriptional regulator [Bacillus subtilis J26]TWG71425.1 TetR family transcriptional regulator [Bacillus subtilis J24]